MRRRTSRERIPTRTKTLTMNTSDSNQFLSSIISINILGRLRPLLGLLPALPLLFLGLDHVEGADEILVDVEHGCPVLEHAAVVGGGEDGH